MAGAYQNKRRGVEEVDGMGKLPPGGITDCVVFIAPVD